MPRKTSGRPTCFGGGWTRSRRKTTFSVERDGHEGNARSAGSSPAGPVATTGAFPPVRSRDAAAAPRAAMWAKPRGRTTSSEENPKASRIARTTPEFPNSPPTSATFGTGSFPLLMLLLKLRATASHSPLRISSGGLRGDERSRPRRAVSVGIVILDGEGPPVAGRFEADHLGVLPSHLEDRPYLRGRRGHGLGDAAAG